MAGLRVPCRLRGCPPTGVVKCCAGQGQGAKLSRREWLGLSAALFLEPVRRVEAAVKPVRIRDVECFEINIPVSKAESEAGVNHRYSVVKVMTDAGVNGISFAGPGQNEAHAVRKVLGGKDLFNIEQHLKDGLGAWGGVEHAVWDAIGKIAGQPAYRLLGGSQSSVKAYLTCVWRGNPDQSHVAFGEQAEMAAKIKQAGFKGMKIRAWRPNPTDDAEALAEIRRAVGPDFAVMFDRTAHVPETAGQKIWDYETGLRVARALEKHNATWLEEPFARDDYESPARLAAAVDIAITGGEGYSGVEPFRQCLLHRTYDILQPEGRGSGGIFTCRKVAALAEAFHVPCILHGTMGLMLAGWLQATLAIGSEWQEVALIWPPLMPDEQWAPSLRVLKSKELIAIREGMLLGPDYPGIGLDVDEDALEKFRVGEA
ncbi:MAG: mandelate racemase/muconate lactonizing enzyme family protein [Bryobacteraceae bacterium]|nr:mandelate racemase/muconate lactonizing enzyme family protein [Bryobacteraceae bacterium]